MPRLVRLLATVLSTLLLLAFALLAIRGLLDAPTAAANFGVPVDHPAAAAYQLVYRSRNLVIALTGLVFLLLGMWRALAILTTACIALPLFDILLLRDVGIPVAAIHPVTLAALVLLSTLLWWRVRLDRVPAS